MNEKPIVFFDGVCGLCNTMVDFFIRKDKKRRLLFAPMQGSTARGILSDEEITLLNSFVLFEGGKKYYKSAAALRIYGKLGGLWPLMKVFIVVPRFIRDSVYNIVAQHRYDWFGKKETCRIPTLEERGVILD